MTQKLGEGGSKCKNFCYFSFTKVSNLPIYVCNGACPPSFTTPSYPKRACQLLHCKFNLWYTEFFNAISLQWMV
jgi:hypothetical protein